MSRGTFERRLSLLDAAIRELRFNQPVLLMRFATEPEAHRLLELLDTQVKNGRGLPAKTVSEETVEIVALFETWKKRLKESLNRQ